MEVEGEEEHTNTKRKPECHADDENEELLHFFEHFRVPPNLWGAFLRIQVGEVRGLLYLHNHTNKPIIIAERRDGDRVCGYNIHFQTNEEKAHHKVLLDKTELEVMGFDREDYQLSILHRLEMIAARYTLEGCLLKQEDALRHCDEFLADMGLLRIENPSDRSIKKRRGDGDDPTNKDVEM